MTDRAQWEDCKVCGGDQWPSPPTTPPTAERTVFAWLAERGQSEHHTPTVWWSGDESIGWGGWTPDANLGLRFPDEATATAYIEARSPIPAYRDRWARAVEHGFLATPPTAVEPEAGEWPSLFEIIEAMENRWRRSSEGWDGFEQAREWALDAISRHRSRRFIGTGGSGSI